MSSDEKDLLKDALVTIRSLRARLQAAERAQHEPIAIVGIGCRFPGGADSPERFWQILRDGVDTVSRVPENRWNADALYDRELNTPGKMYVREGSFLEDVETFDAAFFGISPREALRLDPQQRMMLEVSWEALEHAGIAPDTLRGSSTGVFAGVMNGDYAMRQANGLTAESIDPYMLAGSDLSFAAGRVAHFLGLQGPALATATACSSSLVSVHLACQALRQRECDLALAAGVNLIADPVTSIMLSQLRALAPDGRSKTFDASADGYGRGEGCGVVVLRRLSDALAEGQKIFALIRGSAVNHDGPSAGLTVPNGMAQEKVVRRALENSAVSPGEVGYVEVHGTGTALGDPIEVHALARVFGERSQPLFAGSVKTNIGHLEAAAGIASLIKVVLMLEKQEIPPHLHFQRPNPHIAWSEIPVQVPTARKEWTHGVSRRIAGISSFGISGVNAHMVLEEPPPPATVPATADRPFHVLTLSAKTMPALEAQVARMDAWLKDHPDADWADVCFTANLGRAQLSHRIAVVAESSEEARRLLAQARRVSVPAQATEPVLTAKAAEHAASREEWKRLLEERAAAYLRGARVDWLSFEREYLPLRRHVSLPTYAFQRERFWVLDPAPAGMPAQVSSARNPIANIAGRCAPALGRDRAWLTAWLREHVQAALGMAAPPPEDVSLLDLGMDSLMSQELQNAMQREVGIGIPVGEFISGASITVLAGHIAGRAGEAPEEEPGVALTPRTNATRYAMSPGQSALWFLHRSSPESVAYNVGLAVRLHGPIQMQAFRQMLLLLAERHENLRTVIREDASGQMEAEIVPRAEIAFREHDANGCSEAELADRVKVAYAVPFDLTDRPAWRVDLFTQSPERHLLLLGIHHILCDALSCWTLLEEMMRVYAAAATGRRVPLAPLEHTYAEFANRQLALLDSAEGQKLKAYWRKQLAGELPVLQLPSDKPPPLVQRFHGATERLLVSADLTDALRSLAQEHKVTLFTLLLAAYQVLLSRWSGQEEILTGTATSVRPPEFHGVVGYFVQPVALRGDLSGNPAFTDFLAQMRVTVLEAIAHRQLPFSSVVEMVLERREASRSPVFQTDFALNKTATAALRSGPKDSVLEMELFELAEEEGQFDLSLHCTEDKDTLTARFKYNTDLFTADTVRQMAECFGVLLRNLVRDPKQRVLQIALLADQERSERMQAGRGAEAVYARSPVCAVFEQQARLTPDAVAVEFFAPEQQANAELSYAELNRRANRLARELQKIGCDPKSRVGIYVGPSIERMVGILAVLKTGAAYVPLDSTYPPERLEYIAADAEIQILLLDGAQLAFTVADEVARIMLPLMEDTEGKDMDLAVEIAPDSLAYILYTSGSTGRPKGAMITHSGLANYLAWCVETYELRKGCGAPVNTAFGFDATITSMFSPLMTGGRVVFLPEEQTMEALAALLRVRKGFSLVKITPAQLEILGYFMADEDCRGSTHALVIGGEALHAEVLTKWRKHAPETRLINEYGPTETVVGCAIYEWKPAVEGLKGKVPIGRPIANTQLYVLDATGELAPRGVAGELYIGGAGVARGYLNRPELTAERFVPDRFREQAGAKMYRSGDLVRWRHDGELEFLGRADSQLKLRGYRIEPGEIESVLSEHSAVRESVVATHGQALTVYLVATASADELRRFLRTKLPEYMIPQFFIFMDALPLTANGKIDRKALPAPQTLTAEKPYVPPRDHLEARLKAIWEAVLQTGSLGIYDNFFERGGHSLLALRLMASIRREMGKDLPLASILRHGTISQLAEILRKDVSTIRGSALVPIQPKGSKPPLFCVPGAGGNAIYLHNLGQQLGQDQPFYGLQGRGMDGEAEPHTTVEEMADYYIDAMRGVQPHGPYHLAGHSLGGWVVFEMAHRLEQSGEEVAFLGIIDTPIPAAADTGERSGWNDARWISELAQRIAQLLNPALEVREEELCGLDHAAQMKYFRNRLVEAGVFPEQAGADGLENTVALFKAHANVRYLIDGKRSSTRIHLYRTASTPGHRPELADDRAWGWGRAGEVVVVDVTGEHLSLLRPPHVEQLAAEMSTALEQVASDVNPKPMVAV